ncbi:hypothetical protein ACVOMV_26920 (plasmid) [Mesorhizobium atlanticum]|uniref:hypothetical protein n=1 Tax=Mesorhizobium atlanticum TaxID=2233532 RepID=UPI003703760F
MSDQFVNKHATIILCHLHDFGMTRRQIHDQILLTFTFHHTILKRKAAEGPGDVRKSLSARTDFSCNSKEGVRQNSCLRTTSGKELQSSHEGDLIALQPDGQIGDGYPRKMTAASGITMPALAGMSLVREGSKTPSGVRLGVDARAAASDKQRLVSALAMAVTIMANPIGSAPAKKTSGEPPQEAQVLHDQEDAGRRRTLAATARPTA